MLVDTEPTATRVLIAMLARLGVVMDDEECSRTFVGRSAAASLDIIAGRLDRPLPATFPEDWHALLFAELRRGVSPVPGIVAALDAITLPVCVASSGGHDRMQITLGSSGLLPRFSGRIFSATDVARGKPFPDVFLHAARTLNAEPARTAVVEDSPAGVAAGVAAGMTVFGYAGGGLLPDAELAAAGAHVFHDMRSLPDLLAAGAPSLDMASDGR